MPRALKKRSRKNIKNKEPFTQRPNNFPQSKVDDFSQNWEALLDKFDEEFNNIGSSVGSYGSGRDEILTDILTAVKNGDYRSVQMIEDMSDALYDAAINIESKKNDLNNIIVEFNKVSGSGINVMNSLKDKASKVMGINT